MKTLKFLFAGIILTTTATLTAQDKNSGNSSFGIKGGLNYSTITKGDFDEGPDPRTSFYLGFVGEIPVVENVFSIQPEVLYSRQGFEVNQTILGTNYKTEYKLDYINVPVLAKIHLGKVFSIEAGPQFGLKISEKYENEDSSIETDDVNEFDTALAAGVSLNFDGGFFISGRFTQSLNEVVKDSGSKNQVIQAGVGFKF
ncbi:porin family protein [Flavobacterium sp.]|uniref:porin family protein n=1 Tax=Flavobacterium sp. TaxID=239 RepID=UPI0028BE555B|nr:porin family protein [Flavobacterium sp.]